MAITAERRAEATPTQEPYSLPKLAGTVSTAGLNAAQIVQRYARSSVVIDALLRPQEPGGDGLRTAALLARRAGQEAEDERLHHERREVVAVNQFRMEAPPE